MTDPHRSPDASPWVSRFLPLVRPDGLILDLAAGRGRHTRAALALGHRVVAVDIDVAGLADLEADGRVEIVRADLEGAPWPFAGRRFDAIVVTNYLHRPLLRHLGEGLSGGGILIYETFMAGNERYGRPSNPDFLLAAGELLDSFGDLRVIAFEQGLVRQPRPAAVQRLAAGRPEAAAALWPIPDN